MAKTASNLAAKLVCDEAMQLLGGYGYSREYPVERAYRDIRGLCIGAGTVETQRNYIGLRVAAGRVPGHPAGGHRSTGRNAASWYQPRDERSFLSWAHGNQTCCGPRPLRGQAGLRAGLPYDVFEVRRMDTEDFTALGMLGKLRSTAHRRMTAYTVRADQCQECGLCVTACPEDAITLAPQPVT